MAEAAAEIGHRLEEGRAALERHAWQEGHELLKEADQDGALEAEDLDRLSQAAWWAGHLDEAISIGQRAFAAHASADQAEAAAMAALWLAILHAIYKPAAAVAAGWIRRAERLLEEQPESAAHGYVAGFKASMLLEASGDLEAVEPLIQRGLEIGRRFQDPDLVALGLLLQARVLVQRGQLDRAMELVDEAMTSVITGELSPFFTGAAFCQTIGLCTQLGDYQRAGEWTQEALRWCEEQSINGYPGHCRIYKASIYRLLGDWVHAEEEARQGIHDMRPYGPLIVGEGLNEIGEIYLRKGDLAAAAEAFREAQEVGWHPQPGLSLLRLAEGNVQAGAASIRSALEERPKDPLARAKLLPVQAEIALTAGDLRTARQAVGEMEAISQRIRTFTLEASSLQARGRLELAEGQPARARQSLREAWRRWSEAKLPYEEARCRELVAATYQAEGEEEAARLELESARATYERLGARRDLERVEAVLKGEAPMAPPAVGREVRRTFLFTDIVGSTHLLEAIGDQAWRDLRRWHDDTLRACFARHAGEEVDHAGDGFFVAFDTAEAALDCAIEIQSVLAEHRRQHGFSPQVRIGVHGAEATQRGQEYMGRGVHQAARIAAVAEGGEILVSRETLPASARYQAADSRQVSLKGIATPVEVVRLGW